MDSIHEARYRSMLAEKNMLQESLNGIQSSDERANSVFYNISCIIAVNALMMQEKANKTPDTKLILRYKDMLVTCTRAIKDHMLKLGANEECITKMKDFISTGDIDGAKVHMLILLAKRNPGLYRRKLAECQSAVKQK